MSRNELTDLLLSEENVNEQRPNHHNVNQQKWQEQNEQFRDGRSASPQRDGNSDHNNSKEKLGAAEQESNKLTRDVWYDVERSGFSVDPSHRHHRGCLFVVHLPENMQNNTTQHYQEDYNSNIATTADANNKDDHAKSTSENVKKDVNKITEALTDRDHANSKDEGHATQLSELSKEAFDKLQSEREHKRHVSELVQNDLVKPPLMQHPTTHLTEQKSLEQQQQQQQQTQQEEKVKNELEKDSEPKLAQFAFMTDKDKSVAESAQKMSDSPKRTSEYVRLLSESDAEPAHSKKLLASQIQSMTASVTHTEKMEAEKLANTTPPPPLQEKNEEKKPTTKDDDNNNNKNVSHTGEAAVETATHNATDAKETIHKSAQSVASSALGQSSTTHLGITPAASSTTSSTHSSAVPLASSLAHASNSLGLSLSGRLSHVEPSRCFVVWASYDYLEKKHPALMPSDEDDGKRKDTKVDKSSTKDKKEKKSLFPSSSAQNPKATHTLSTNENAESTTSSSSSESSSTSSSSLSLSSNSSLWSPYHQVKQTGNAKDKAEHMIWESSSIAKNTNTTPHKTHELSDKKDDNMLDAPHPKEPVQSNMQLHQQQEKQQVEKKEHVRTLSNNRPNVDDNNNINLNTDTNKVNKPGKVTDKIDNVHYDDEGVCVIEDDVIVLKASELLEVKIVSAPFDQKSKKASVVAFVAPDKCAEQCNLPTQETDKEAKPTTDVNEFTPLLQRHHERASSPSTKTNTTEHNDEHTNPLHTQKLSGNATANTITNNNEQNDHSGAAGSGNRVPHTIEYKFALLRGGAVKLSDALKAARPDLNTDIVLGSPLLSVAQDDEKDNKHTKRNEATPESEHADANNYHNHTHNDHTKDNKDEKHNKKEIHNTHEDHLHFSQNNDKSSEGDKKEGSLLERAIDMVKNVVLPIPAEEREHVKHAESKILPHHDTQAEKEKLMEEQQERKEEEEQEESPKHKVQEQQEQENEFESSGEQSPPTPAPSPSSMLGKFQRLDEENNNDKEEKKKANNVTHDDKLTSDDKNNNNEKHKLEEENQNQKQKQKQEHEEQEKQKQEELQQQQQEKLKKEEQQEQELLNSKLQEQEQKNKSEKEHKLEQQQQDLQQSEEQERDHVLRETERLEEEELEKQEKEERNRLNSHDKQTEVKPTTLPSQASSTQANEVILPKLKPSQMEMGSPLTTFDWQSCFVNDEAARKSTSVSTNSLAHPSPRSLSPHLQENAAPKTNEFIKSNPTTSSINKNAPTVLPDVHVPNNKDNNSEQITESDQKHEIEEEHDEMKRDKVIDEQVKAEERELEQNEPVKPTSPIPTPTKAGKELPKSNIPHASPEEHSLPPSRSSSSPPLSAAGQTLSPSEQQQQQQQQQQQPSSLREEQLRPLQKSALHISTMSQSLSTASSAASMESEEREDETHTILVESKYQKAREKAFFGGIEEYIRFEVWTHLLDVYPATSCFSQRAKILQDNEQLFRHLTAQWQTILPIQEQHWKLYREQRDGLLNDVIKLQSLNSAFADTNAPKLRGVRKLLMAHLFYDFDFGYASGMNEIAALTTLISPCEEMSFLCYRALVVQQLRSAFNKDENGDNLAHKLQQVRVLIRHFNKPLYDYLISIHAEDMTVCARWLQTMFVSEFPLNETKKLWDVILACPFTRHFDVFIAAALLDAFSETIRNKLSTHDTILQFNSKLSGNVEISEVILYSQLFYNKVCDEVQRLVTSDANKPDVEVKSKTDAKAVDDQKTSLNSQTPMHHDQQQQQQQEQQIQKKQLSKADKTFTVDEVEHVLLQKDGPL